ncbi:hypothetical protein [Glaciihabitans sp. UYNi722]|uniref:hypothetical protein n=1 Tax=Glaciihabitans sp. UYNi722 TaxID=3156344 RepID=UPI00339634E0
MENEDHHSHEDNERQNLPPPNEIEDHMSASDTAELPRLTPEAEASARFQVDLDNYERAKKAVITQLETEAGAGNPDGLTFGVLVDRLSDLGIPDHLASQAIDSMRGRQVRVTNLGAVALRPQE